MLKVMSDALDPLFDFGFGSDNFLFKKIIDSINEDRKQKKRERKREERRMC